MITLSLFAFALLFFQQFAEARSGVFLEKLQEEYPECGPLRDTSDSKLGNGECDEGTIYNTAECGYDLGDCLISDYPDCHVTHPSQIGDGICNEEYNTLVCAFDGADCSAPEEGFDIDGNELRSSGETAGIVFGAMAIVSLILSSQYVFVRSRNNGNVVAAVNTNPRRISPSDAASVASWNPAALFYWAPLHAVRTDRRKKEERIALVMKSIIRKKVLYKGSKNLTEDLIIQHRKEADVVPFKQPCGSASHMSCSHHSNHSIKENDEFSCATDEEKGHHHTKGHIFIDTSSMQSPRNNISSNSAHSMSSARYNFKMESSCHTKDRYTDSINSPKMCPVCCEDFKNGDDIAWSRNEECIHAFHVCCILEWLLENDVCPLCRCDYICSDDASRVGMEFPIAIPSDEEESDGDVGDNL